MITSVKFLRPLFCSAYITRILHSTVITLNRYKVQNMKYKKCNTSIVLFSMSWFSSQPNVLVPEDELVKQREELIRNADSLYQRNKHREICNLLNPFKNGNDVEVLWRLVRAQYNLAQEFSISPEEKKTLIFEGFDTIKRSLRLDADHYANHKWMSIMIDSTSCYHGIKARISQLENVKKHMQRATQLNPKDATTLYMLGVWCFEIANMPWYQRKIASTIFAAPPVSSFEEALSFFSRAEETEPRFYSMNLLMLGKTYLKLNKIDKAKYYLDLASNYPAQTDDDITANKEATELLKKLKNA